MASFGNTFPVVIFFLHIPRLCFMYHCAFQASSYILTCLMPGKHFLCGICLNNSLCFCVKCLQFQTLHTHTQNSSRLQTLCSDVAASTSKCSLPSYLCAFPVLIKTTERMVCEVMGFSSSSEQRTVMDSLS